MKVYLMKIIQETMRTQLYIVVGILLTRGKTCTTASFHQ